MKRKILPTIQATEDSISGYGLLIDQKVSNPGLSIPFYNGTVEEGKNIPFQ